MPREYSALYCCAPSRYTVPDTQLTTMVCAASDRPVTVTRLLADTVVVVQDTVTGAAASTVYVNELATFDLVYARRNAVPVNLNVAVCPAALRMDTRVPTPKLFGELPTVFADQSPSVAS